MTRVDTQRYTIIAMILHWVMAMAFFLMLGSGLAMGYLDLDKSFLFQMIQWHKSLGVLLLVAFVLRVVWRLSHKPPALPAAIKGFDAVAAKLGHIGLYALMLAVPLSGWIMVSSSVYGLPTIVFGWFEWPHIPAIAANETINGGSRFAHEWLAWAFLLLIAGHIAAVIKHAVKEKVNLLPRMYPAKKSYHQE